MTDIGPAPKVELHKISLASTFIATKCWQQNSLQQNQCNLHRTSTMPWAPESLCAKTCSAHSGQCTTLHLFHNKSPPFQTPPLQLLHLSVLPWLHTPSMEPLTWTRSTQAQSLSAMKSRRERRSRLRTLSLPSKECQHPMMPTRHLKHLAFP